MDAVKFTEWAPNTDNNSQNKSYWFDESVQVLHLKRVWVHVVQMLKLPQKSLIIHRQTCRHEVKDDLQTFQNSWLDGTGI